MSTAPTTELDPMRKEQRTIQMPKGGYELCHHLETRSGAKLNRQLFAALLKFFFDGIENPDNHAKRGPDVAWFRLGVAVERGELAVQDIPLTLLDAAIAEHERHLVLCNRPGTLAAEHADKEELRLNLAALRLRRRTWANNIEDLGGAWEALDYMLDGLFPSFGKPLFQDTEEDTSDADTPKKP